MSSWNRPPYPLASVFTPSAGSGAETRVSVSTWMEPSQAPRWFSPFTLDKNTRFTRTPDVFMRPPGSQRDTSASALPAARPAPTPDEEAVTDAVEDDEAFVAPIDEVEEAFAALAAADERFGFDEREEAAATARATMPAAAEAAAPDTRHIADEFDEAAFADETAPGDVAEASAPAATRAAALLADLLEQPRPDPHDEPAGLDGEALADPRDEWLADPADELLTVAAEELLAGPAEELPADEADELQAEPPELLADAPEELFGDPQHELPTDQAGALAADPDDEWLDEPTEELRAAPCEDLLAELPEAIRRLAGLIVIAPPAPPVAAAEQDLVGTLEDVAVEALAAEADADQETVDQEIVDDTADGEDEEIADQSVEKQPEPEAVVASADDEAPETAPAAETEDAAELAQAAAPAPFPSLGMGSMVRASFGWPVFALTAALPAELPTAPAGETAAEAEADDAVEAAALDDFGGIDDEEDLNEEDLNDDDLDDAPGYQLPPLRLLTEPPQLEPAFELSEEFLDRNSAALQQTLWDFGVRGQIIDANPGPVVTLYEFEPAPGTKSSRVIGLSADIARSMSAISTRVAVVEGRNVIGIELPNQRRETVWLRELLASHAFADASGRLGICLGKTIGGDPVIVDLARMPHLLVAGTTGSGKSVAINTMILSLLYRLSPEQCRLIMIDPKMLELSVYEGIPHLLTPVVTDPKKAIIALQWAVREMEERYRKMSRLKVRNIEGFNARVAEARRTGEVITSTVESGFDRDTGELVYDEVTMDLASLPYIVIIVDEMADLMMVAGKDIEGAIQRLAQMARAAGIHLVMATQLSAVDVITGTIKANVPTRISFQVTSKIDSRTILGEMGAETLLGQGDMLYMANGGRITRVHGPFVSDGEVEKVVAHLKTQGRPEYLEAVTADETDEEPEEDTAVFDKSPLAAEDGADHYDQAVAIVLRDRKASTSYIQRRLQIGYNRAASLMERMENEGIVGPANHAGKREILANRAG